MSLITVEATSTHVDAKERLEFTGCRRQSECNELFGLSGEKPMSLFERRGDMGEGLKLRIFKEDDGDLIVSIMPADARLPTDGESVQFCTPGNGGGKSPRTWNALFELWQAMREDSAAAAGLTPNA